MNDLVKAVEKVKTMEDEGVEQITKKLMPPIFEDCKLAVATAKCWAKGAIMLPFAPDAATQSAM